MQSLATNKPGREVAINQIVAKLYQEYKDNGLVIIGFPCNQFGKQEPGTSEEIQEFCSTNYNVTFPLSEKIEVNGSDVHPLYKYLKKV